MPPDRVHKAQTSTAPKIAPRLLPEPPTISMVQIWKVRIGRKSSGAMKPTKCA